MVKISKFLTEQMLQEAENIESLWEHWSSDSREAMERMTSQYVKGNSQCWDITDSQSREGNLDGGNFSVNNKASLLNNIDSQKYKQEEDVQQVVAEKKIQQKKGNIMQPILKLINESTGG